MAVNETINITKEDLKTLYNQMALSKKSEWIARSSLTKERFEELLDKEEMLDMHISSAIQTFGQVELNRMIKQIREERLKNYINTLKGRELYIATFFMTKEQLDKLAIKTGYVHANSMKARLFQLQERYSKSTVAKIIIEMSNLLGLAETLKLLDKAVTIDKFMDVDGKEVKEAMHILPEEHLNKIAPKTVWSIDYIRSNKIFNRGLQLDGKAKAIAALIDVFGEQDVENILRAGRIYGLSKKLKNSDILIELMTNDMLEKCASELKMSKLSLMNQLISQKLFKNVVYSVSKVCGSELEDLLIKTITVEDVIKSEKDFRDILNFMCEPDKERWQKEAKGAVECLENNEVITKDIFNKLKVGFIKAFTKEELDIFKEYLEELNKAGSIKKENQKQEQLKTKLNVISIQTNASQTNASGINMGGEALNKIKDNEQAKQEDENTVKNITNLVLIEAVYQLTKEEKKRLLDMMDISSEAFKARIKKLSTQKELDKDLYINLIRVKGKHVFETINKAKEVLEVMNMVGLA